MPAQVEGLPVVGITADALSGAELLTQLSLPATIEALPGNCFSGLKSLKHLILLHMNKLCVISKDTFEGTKDLAVHVPADVYPLYRDGQGCEENTWAAMVDMIVPMQ